MLKNLLHTCMAAFLPPIVFVLIFLASQACKKDDSDSGAITPVTSTTATSTTATSTTTVNSSTTILGSLRKPVSDVLGFSILDVTAFPENYSSGYPLPANSPYNAFTKNEADWLTTALNKDTRKFVKLPFIAVPNVQIWWIPEPRNGYYVIMASENGIRVFIDYNLISDTQFRYEDGTLSKTQVTGHGVLTNVGGTTNNTNRVSFGKL